MFALGSLRAKKGRTNSMRGANPQPVRGKRQRRRKGDAALQEQQQQQQQLGEDGSDSDTSSAEEADDVATATLSAGAALLSCEESWVHMLCLIRGVSEEKAAVIARAFPSVRALLDAYAAQPGRAEAERLLAALRCGARNIGEQVSRRVHDSLWATAMFSA